MKTHDIANDEIYARQPDSEFNGIPIFSKEDIYVKNYEKIAKDHISQISETHENPFMEEELWSSLEASTRAYIQRHVEKGSRILDVGVGLGRLLEPLTEYERYGVDISLDYLAIAKRRGIEVAMAKIEELPYQPGFFDAIVVCDVLEHVIDLNYCCEKILSCLKPGGVLIVRVPFKEDLEVYTKQDLPYEFIHLRNFDEAGLRIYFEKIFNLLFLEGSPTTPYLQGSPRLRLRLLPEKVRVKLLEISAQRSEFLPIANALDISEEAFQAWIYELKDSSNDLFRSISEHLILGIEINAVFVKPLGEPLSHLTLRSSGIQAPQNSQELLEVKLMALENSLFKFNRKLSEQLLSAEKKLENLISQLSIINLAITEQSTPFYRKFIRKFRRILKDFF